MKQKQHIQILIKMLKLMQGKLGGGGQQAKNLSGIA